MSTMRAIVNINVWQRILTLSEQSENSIHDVSLIAHQLADIVAELENVVGQFKL